jgi:hypothetical protein
LGFSHPEIMHTPHWGPVLDLKTAEWLGTYSFIKGFLGFAEGLRTRPRLSLHGEVRELRGGESHKGRGRCFDREL